MTVARTKWLNLKIPTITRTSITIILEMLEKEFQFIYHRYYFNQRVEDVNDKTRNASVDTNRKDPKLLYIKQWIED